MKLILPLTSSNFDNTNTPTRHIAALRQQLVLYSEALNSINFNAEVIVLQDVRTRVPRPLVKRYFSNKGVFPTVIKVGPFTKGSIMPLSEIRPRLVDSEILIVEDLLEAVSKNVDFNAAVAALRNYDSGVVTSSTPNASHAYARFDTNGTLAEITNTVIENSAVTGIHYWKTSLDLIASLDSVLQNTFINAPMTINAAQNSMVNRNKSVGRFTV